MNIRPFDFSDADYAALVRINEAAWPGQSDSESYWRRHDEQRDRELLFRRVMAQTEDGVAGYASYGHNAFTYRPDRFLIDVRVDAAHQGQGVGAALYDHVAQAIIEHRPNALEAMTREDLPRANRFLEDRGFAQCERVAVSELDAGDLDRQAFAPVMEKLEAGGVRLRTWSQLGGEPKAERRLYDLMNLLHLDVPWYDKSESESEAEDSGPHGSQPFDTWVKSYRDNPDFLPDALVVAVDGDGRWLGMSQIWGSQASDDTFYTGLTGVRREARRQGIATALKVASISNLPPMPAGKAGPFVRTDNEENNPMLSLNLRLGFKPQPATLFYVKMLDI